MSTEPPACAPADPDPRPPGFAVPQGACDCHAHVFGPRERYPYTPERDYTPPEANLAAYRHMLKTLGTQRGVIVQPSVYGTDNTCTLEAVETLGEDCRAVVVVAPTVSEAELEAMHARGARGVRVNLLFRGGGTTVEDLARLAERIQPLRWHLQLLVDVSHFESLAAIVARLPVPVVIDHMGHMDAGLGVEHPGFQVLLEELSAGRVWVKLSAAYRLTRQAGYPYDDVGVLARALVTANPARLVWGSDWPHPRIHTSMPNDGDLLGLLADWAPDEEHRRRILVDNPASLYDFSLP